MKHISRITSVLVSTTALLLPLMVLAGPLEPHRFSGWSTALFVLSLILLFVIIPAVVLAVVYGFTIWMIVDALGREFERRVVWVVGMIVLFIVFPVAGFFAAIVYYFTIRRGKNRIK